MSVVHDFGVSWHLNETATPKISRVYLRRFAPAETTHVTNVRKGGLKEEETNQGD